MKKFTILLPLFALSTSISAADLCTKFESNKRYMNAIRAVSKFQNYTKEEFCNLPNILSIEVQPSHTIDNQGNEIPHVRVQQHSSWDSCLYLVNELDYSMTKTYCYSGM